MLATRPSATPTTAVNGRKISSTRAKRFKDEVVWGAIGVAIGAGIGSAISGVAGRVASRGIRVSEKGLGLIGEHLAQFGEVEYNSMMMQRPGSALNSGARITGADATFYLHEASEATMQARGLSQPAAHAAALSKYGSEYDLYHPDVIKALPQMFNQTWFRYWNIFP